MLCIASIKRNDFFRTGFNAAFLHHMSQLLRQQPDILFIRHNTGRQLFSLQQMHFASLGIEHLMFHHFRN